MKHTIIKSFLCITFIIALSVTTVFAWLITETTFTQNIVVKNGNFDKLTFKLYRGYDYDLNGTLDVLNEDETEELVRYYMDITDVTDDVVTSIVESSIITYRLYIENSSEDSFAINPYFYFEENYEDNLNNNYKSILFRLNSLSIIHNYGKDNEVTFTEYLSSSLCMYADSEFLTKNVYISQNETVCLDFTLKASNLTEINEDLGLYNSHSKNKYYDLSNKLYYYLDGTLELVNGEITNNEETRTITDGVGSGTVLLSGYSCKLDDDTEKEMYTCDYYEYSEVYKLRQKQDSTVNMDFRLSQICVDVKNISKDALQNDKNSLINDRTNALLSTFTYGDNLLEFYTSTGDIIETTNYNFADGLYDASGNPILEVFSSTHKYTFVYENDTVIRVVKEVKTS